MPYISFVVVAVPLASWTHLQHTEIQYIVQVAQVKLVEPVDVLIVA